LSPGGFHLHSCRQSDHKGLAGELLQLLNQKRELEAQMLVSTKTLYKAYECINKELGIVLANSVNGMVAGEE
jgi:hypothetical protein